MATPIEICNLALDLIGAEGVLQSLNDQTKAGRLCKKHYDNSRRSVLRDHFWKFAMKRAVLSPLGSQPPFTTDFQFQFPLPTDCLRVYQVDDWDTKWVLEGRILMCNDGAILTQDADGNQVPTIEPQAGGLNLKYIYDVTDTSLFDPLFCDYFAVHLGWKICYAITKSQDRVEGMMRQLDMWRKRAKFCNATEDSVKILVADEFDNVRIGPNRGFVRDPQT